MLFIERKKGIFPGLLSTHQQANMDYIAVAPLNAKGTCFRVIAVASKTPKHIKTKKN